MSNNTLSYKTCQPLHNEITLSPRYFFSKHLLRSDIRILSYLYSLCNKYKNNTYPSQDRIAKDTGYSRKTVNESISRLRSFGIISTITRYKKTCLYYLHDFFNSNACRKNLSSFMRYYVSFSLLLLVPTPGVTQIKLNVLKTNLVSSSSIRESINYADARANETRQDAIKKESLNEAHFRRSTLETSARLTKLKQKFPLLPHGEITLSVFPEQAIDHAESMLSKVYVANQPFGYFLALCKGYCTTNKIPLNWKKYYDLKQALMIDNDAPTLDLELLEGMRKLHKQEPARKTYNKKESHKSEDQCPANVKARLLAQHLRDKEKFRQDGIKTKEFNEEYNTPFKVAEDCERKFHQALISNPSKKRLPLPVPGWEELAIEDKCKIMTEQHPNCTCRDREKISLGLVIVPPVTVPLDKIISAQPKQMSYDPLDPFEGLDKQAGLYY